MGSRGMIVQELVEKVLSTEIRGRLAQQPRAERTTPEQLAGDLSCLANSGEGKYEVVPLGVVVSADEVYRTVAQVAHEA